MAMTLNPPPKRVAKEEKKTSGSAQFTGAKQVGVPFSPGKSTGAASVKGSMKHGVYKT